MKHAVTIESVQGEPLDVPLHEPFRISRGTLSSVRNVLVRVTLSDGTEGLGEAAPFPELTGESPQTVMASLEIARNVLEGMSIGELRQCHQRLQDVLKSQRAARAGIEGSLIDAWSRAAEAPLFRLLGGAGSTLVTDLTIPIVPRDEAMVLARAAKADGIRTLKTKVGLELEDDIDRVEGISLSYPEAPLILDANQGYSPKQALRLLDELCERGIRPAMFEQPVHADDLQGLRFVRERTPVPVYADEAVTDAASALRIIRAEAADGLNIKLAKTGGLLEALDVAALARSAGLGLMVGAMVETRLGLTCAAHLAAGLGGFSHVDLDTHMLLSHDPFEGGFSQEGDRLRLDPSAPGIGITAR